MLGFFFMTGRTFHLDHRDPRRARTRLGRECERRAPIVVTMVDRRAHVDQESDLGRVAVHGRRAQTVAELGKVGLRPAVSVA
jgi:2-phospho-L-lactate guanylyltransferase (CobY/MobA/RfbA family)